MSKKKKVKWTADMVVDLLRERYGKTGQGGSSKRYVFVEQVAPATGFSRRATWIDGMALSMWPSDGLHREAFEVKVARQDFLSEIRDPAKNLWFKTHCHFFWYVTGPDVVSTADEIPEGCGWMLAQKGRLVIKKQATRKDLPKTIDADFFAAVARSMENESQRQQRAAQKKLREQADVALGLQTVRHLSAWLKEQGVDLGWTSPGWENMEELDTHLAAAMAGSGNINLAQALESQLVDLRDSIGKTVIELLPYAAHLLGETDKVGRQLNHFLGKQGSYDLLADLRKGKSLYGRKERPEYRRERQAKLALMTEMLLLSEVAAEELEEDQQGDHHAGVQAVRE